MSDRKLFDAANRGDNAVVSQLTEQEASVDWREEDGDTALHRAAQGGHNPVVTRLLEAG